MCLISTSDKRGKGQEGKWRGSWGHVERGSKAPDHTGFVSPGRSLASALRETRGTGMLWSDSCFWRIALTVVTWVYTSVNTQKLQPKTVHLLYINYTLMELCLRKVPLDAGLRTDSIGCG